MIEFSGNKKLWLMSPMRRIQERRKALSLSQEDLAEVIGTNQKQISKYETGKNDPTGDVLIALADALDTTVDYLLGRTNTPDRPLRGFDLRTWTTSNVKLSRF